MECPICFNLIDHSCVGSCMHHFCYNCLCKWIIKGKGNGCPVCKEHIYEIKFDREFDNINNPNQESIILLFTKKIKIDFKELPPGITICNNQDGEGIKIKKLNKDDACFKQGLKVNDIIMFLNGVPCRDHKSSIEIIKNAHLNKKTIIFDILL